MLKDIEYWKQKNIIYVSDNVLFDRIEDICNLFDIPYGNVKRGHGALGGIEDPFHPNYLYWWPIGYNPDGKWINIIHENYLYIQESHLDIIENEKHYYEYINSNQKRPTFYKDIKSPYKFYGVYIVDKEKSNDVKNGIFWKRISKGFNTEKCHEI